MLFRSSVSQINRQEQTSVVNIGTLRGPEITTNNSESSNFSLIPPGFQINSLGFSSNQNNRTQSQEVEMPKIASIDFSTKSPIKDYLDEKPLRQEQPQTSQKQSEVKRNILDNQAAGEVSIDSIAKQPSGFDLYTSLVIKDMAFYAPKEIYKGQKTVDNTRLLRGLTGGSDLLHQQMIEQQYKKGE